MGFFSKTPAPQIARLASGGRVNRARPLTFTFDGKALRAPVMAGKGNWNLRLRARAEDGTLFQQRIIVRNAG